MHVRFLKRYFLVYILREILKKDGSKYSIIIYPNHNSLSSLTTRKTQSDISENRCSLNFP